MMDYVARFTELARFVDDYVATDVAKVRRFENGLHLLSKFPGDFKRRRGKSCVVVVLP